MDLPTETIYTVFHTIRVTVFGDLAIDCDQNLLRPFKEVETLLSIMADVLVLLISSPEDP
jgi:hypothetical protein